MSDDILIIKVDGKKQSSNKFSPLCVCVTVLAVTLVMIAFYLSCVREGRIAPPSPDCCFIDLDFDF